MGERDGGIGPDDEQRVVEAHLTAVADRRREQDHLRARAAAIRDQLAQARDAAAARHRELAVEERSVDQLSSFSVTRILAGLRGVRDAELGRATAERDAARYLFAVAESRVAALEVTAARVAEDLAALGDVDADWSEALAAKEAWCLAAGSTTAPRLAEIAERRGLLQAELRESGEAVLAGQRALRHLHDARRMLGSADSWSAWDTWFGGGLLVTSVKHDRLDVAARALRSVDEALADFESEVADLGRAATARLELSGWHRGVDLWFDNIFTDLSVRRRIKDAQRDLDDAVDLVERILADIEQRFHVVSAEKAALRAERAGLLAPPP